MRFTVRLLAALAAGLFATPGWCADDGAQRGTVIQIVRDFEDANLGDRRPAVVHWKWTPQQKAKAINYSSVEIVNGSPFGTKCLKLTVSDAMPAGPPEYRMVPLGIDYLPPEADALRMRVKPLSGKLSLAVGGPTVYFGHSDVLTQAIDVDVQTQADWTTVEFSLNERLTRNFRRSEWAHHAPVIYYTRWIQEPMSIVVAAGSAGEVLIDQVELVSHGRGRPYPRYASTAMQPVGSSIDFENADSMTRTFTALTSVAQQPDFSREPHLVREAWPPPAIARVAEGESSSLEVIMTGAEEACFAGVKLDPPAGANAIALKMKAQHAGAGRPGVVVDFVAYAAPATPPEAFPWEALRPPASWRERPDVAFTYYLSPRNSSLRSASFGMYHARRILPKDEWTTVVLPLADFVCFFGQGNMEPAFREQLPLAGEQVFAVTFLSYYGQRSAPTRLLIDEVSFVKVPGNPDQQRSFHQASLPGRQSHAPTQPHRF